MLQAFDTLLNKRDYAAAEHFWSPAYIQHSAHIAPGRDGLFELVRAAPKQLRYENALIVADGDYVMLHGRFSVPGMRKGSLCRRSWHGAMALFCFAALVLTDCGGDR